MGENSSSRNDSEEGERDIAANTVEVWIHLGEERETKTKTDMDLQVSEVK